PGSAALSLLPALPTSRAPAAAPGREVGQLRKNTRWGGAMVPKNLSLIYWRSETDDLQDLPRIRHPRQSGDRPHERLRSEHWSRARPDDAHWGRSKPPEIDRWS